MNVYIKVHVAYRACTIKLKLPLNQKPLMYETKAQLFALLPFKCLSYSTKPQTPMILASSLGTVPVSIKLCMPLPLHVQLLF